MSKINQIIKNLEIIKSRDRAIHKQNCKCELCDTILIARQIKKLVKSGGEKFVLGYIDNFIES